MHERQDLGEARGKSETEKARQNLESEVLVRLNGLSEMSGLRPRSRDGRKSRTVTALDHGSVSVYLSRAAALDFCSNGAVTHG